MTRRGVTVPLWLWLAVALGALAGVPPLCDWGVSRALAAWQQHAFTAELAAVRRVVGADVARWRDPAWQHRAGAAFGALGVGVALVDRAGVQYATTDALQLARQTTAVRQKFRFDPVPTLSLPLAIVSIAAPRPTTDGRPAGAAYLWFSQPIPGVPPPWVAQVATTMALLLTLSLVGWFLARSVLQPLAAMSKAARQIARGDLDVRLPPSRTREVAEVGEALGAMSAALREAQARQTVLEEERRLFIGAIAHDLRTPLFALRGYLKGLESGVVTAPERVAHYIRACSARADALEMLIAELFAYARIEYLAQAPQREPLELGSLIEEAVESARSAAVVKGVTLTLQAPPDPCRLVGDGRLLRRAVQNLLDNGLRHTPPGGCVRARWYDEDTWLVFQIADTGAGIAPGDLPHLFAPLYRAEPSRNRRTGGAGLGLTIARRILRAHGGDLSAANGAEGGAVFTGTVPAAEAPPPRIEADPPPSVPAAASPRG